METTNASGSIVLLMRLARVVYRRSTKELLGIHLAKDQHEILGQAVAERVAQLLG